MLPRTPVKFHYIFNLRDLSRVYEGLTRSTIDKFTNKESILRLWRNECTRVFGDRLINEEDRAVVAEKLMSGLVKGFFDEFNEYIMQSPILFGDFMSANPTDETFIDPRLYEDCGGY
jgi:dynein heavy chain